MAMKGRLFRIGTTKKIFSAVLSMSPNSRMNQGEAVYITKTESCISAIPQKRYIIIANENTAGF